MLKKSIITISLLTVLASTSALAFDEEGFSFGNSLVDAVEQNNVDIVKAALQQGISPNEAGKFETTALHRAALKGNLEITNLLIQNGADVNIRDYGGATPLSIAARAGKDDVAKTLVKNRADIDSIDDQGYSALHRAISNKQISVSKYLIQIGANVNTVNNEGNSPLIDAVRISNPEIVRSLLVKGADRNIKNNKGLDIIAYALKLGNSEIDSLLSKNQQDLMRESSVSSTSVIAEDQNVPAFLRQEAKVATASMGINAVKVPVPDVVVDSLEAENVQPFEINDLQLTGNDVVLEDVNLQKAPRLPSDGNLPASMKKDIAKAAKQNEQMQMAEARKAYQQGLENIKPIELPQSIEDNANTIQFAQNNVPDNKVTYNFEYQPPVQEVYEEPKQAAAPKFENLEVPASLKQRTQIAVQPIQTLQPAAIQNLQTQELSTQPVEAIQVSSGDTNYIQATAPSAPVNNEVAYESEVDQLMNSYASTVNVQDTYETEVDDLMNQLIAKESVPNFSMPQQVVYMAPELTNAEPQNTFVPPAFPRSLTLRDQAPIQTQNFVAEPAYVAAPVYNPEPVYIAAPVAPQNPVIVQEQPVYQNSGNISDYDAYRNDLMRNINDFYNKDSSHQYNPYDISVLDAERKHNLGVTGDSVESVNENIDTKLENEYFEEIINSTTLDDVEVENNLEEKPTK